MTTITAMEATVLEAIRDSEYHDGRDPVGSSVWTGQLDHGLDNRQARGVYASLEKKGLAGFCVERDPNDNTCWLTQDGADALVRAGAEATPA